MKIGTKMNIDKIVADYAETIHKEADSWFSDHVDDYDDWDDAWDDCLMKVTGNDNSIPSSYNEQAVIYIVWDSSFINYCWDLGTDVGSVMGKGPLVTDCYIRYYILERLLDTALYDKWRWYIH